MARYKSANEYDSIELRRLLKGDTYVASTTATLGADGTLSLHIENPADNEDLLFYHGELTHGKTVEWRLWDVFDVAPSDDGTAVPIRNNTVGAADDTGASAATGPTFTGSASEGPHQEQIYPGANTDTVLDGYKILLPAGEEIVAEITEPSNGGDDDVGIRLAFAHLV